MKLFFIGALVLAGVIFGALFCRRNSWLVEKAVSAAKKLFAWIKSKVKKEK